jgi:Ubiquitin-activating enzyme active site
MQDYATFFQKLRWKFTDINPNLTNELILSSSRLKSTFDSNDEPALANIESSMMNSKSSDISTQESQKETKDWARYILELIKEIFLNKNLHNFADCVDIAINLFTELFHIKILEQITKYPEDLITKEGKPFWNNTRRFPEPIAIKTNLYGDLNIIFVKSTAILLCIFFGFDVPSPDIVTDIIKNKILGQEIELYQVVEPMSDEEILSNIDKMEANISQLQSIP